LPDRHADRLAAAGAIVGVVLLWEAVARVGLVNPLFTSSPTRVLAEAQRLFLDGSIFEDIRVSAFELLAGLSAAAAIGVPAGVLLGWSRRLNAAAAPLVAAFHATPRIALVPLLLIWFGIGAASKIAVVFLGAVFPIIVNTSTGVRTVDPELLAVARSYAAGSRQMLLTVALPSSVPMLLAGLRLGISHALVGMVVAEMYGATRGVGYLIATAGARFQTDRLMVGVLLVASAGIVMTGAVHRLERRVERWRPRMNQG
jgi:NitT/TauT family transport system permease protein